MTTETAVRERPGSPLRTEPPVREAVRAPRIGRIDGIDSLRAIAMTAVLAQHCRILPFGWMGVWLFYVISGFVVTTSLLAQPSGESAPSLLGHFYARRAARIWPIYLGYVGVGFVVSGLASGHFAWPALASFVFFYNNFQSAFAHGTFPGFPVGHLWTISVEFQFYVVFGLAFAFLSRRALGRLLLAFLILAPLLRFAAGAWLSAAGYPRLNDAFVIYSVSVFHFDSFAAGALIALGRAAWSRPQRARALLVLGLFAMSLYSAVYLSVNHAHGAHGLGLFRNTISGILFGDQRQVWLYSALAALSAGVLAATLADQTVLAKIARNPVLQAVGRVSYGGYVYHAFCIFWTGRLLALALSPGGGLKGKLVFGALHFALALPATLAMAMASYRFIERPIIGAVSRRLTRSAIAGAA